MAKTKKRTPKTARKSSKKRRFNAPAAAVATPQAATPPTTTPAAQVVAVPSTLLDSQRLGAIRSDVRRTLILTTAFIALELVLWYLLDHTSVGTSLYSQLIK